MHLVRHSMLVNVRYPSYIELPVQEAILKREVVKKENTNQRIYDGWGTISSHLLRDTSSKDGFDKMRLKWPKIVRNVFNVLERGPPLSPSLGGFPFCSP